MLGFFRFSFLFSLQEHYIYEQTNKRKKRRWLRGIKWKVGWRFIIGYGRISFFLLFLFIRWEHLGCMVRDSQQGRLIFERGCLW